MEQQNNKIYVYIIGIGLFFFLLVGIMLYGVKKRSETSKSSDMMESTAKDTIVLSPSPTLIPHPVKGFMEVVSGTGSTRIPQSGEVKLVVRATSSNQDIVGFDLVTSYDTSAFDLVKVTSLNPSFKVFPFQRKQYAAITVTKAVEDKSKTIFQNTSLVEIILQPKKTGRFTFSLNPIGNDSTKFVDVNTEVTYPEVKELSLEIY